MVGVNGTVARASDSQLRAVSRHRVLTVRYAAAMINTAMNETRVSNLLSVTVE